MSLTRAMLAEAGVEDKGAQDRIISAYRAVVDELKSERDTLKEKAKQAEEVTRQRDLEFAREFDGLKAEIATMKAEKVVQDKRSAMSKLLRESKIDERGHKRVLASLNFDDVELDASGDVLNKEKAIERLQDEWKDLVVDQVETSVDVPAPPIVAQETPDLFLQGFDSI